jgi:4-amino-4-deoxy-L-arabinose transferase-like glycosyltransferase
VPNVRRDIAILAILAGVVAFSFQGSRGLYETTEGRYAESAREMLETRNWLVPQLDYRSHLTKPPLAYWAIAGSMAIAGMNEWGARLPNALAFILTVIVLQRLGALLWDERTGFAAGIVYALSPFTAVAANGVHTDMLLSLFELIVVLCYWHAVRSVGESGERRWIITAWGALGAAFMTKGPPSLVVLIAIAAFQIYLARTRRPRPALFIPAGVLLMAAVGLTWYVLVAARTPGLMSYFLHDEVYARIMTAKHGRNSEWYMPLFIFLPPLVLGLGTALAVWIAAIARDRRILAPQRLLQAWRSDPRLAFLLLWLMLPLALFSVARSRLPLYVLPIYPAVVLATARAALLVIETPRARTAAAAAILATAAAIVAVKGASSYAYRSERDMKRLHRTCASLDRGDAAFYLYGSPELFGLQFYLSGNLTRVSDEPKQPWARREIGSLIFEIAMVPRRDSYIIITTAAWRERKLLEKLGAAGVDPTIVRCGTTHALFVCTGRDESATFAIAGQRGPCRAGGQ